jgi:hypothetical protein
MHSSGQFTLIPSDCLELLWHTRESTCSIGNRQYNAMHARNEKILVMIVIQHALIFHLAGQLVRFIVRRGSFLSTAASRAAFTETPLTVPFSAKV